jgi:hypothetical protein
MQESQHTIALRREIFNPTKLHAKEQPSMNTKKLKAKASSSKPLAQP